MSVVLQFAVAAGAFGVMEPATYALHRFVMHGRGWVWHASHHRADRRPTGPVADTGAPDPTVAMTPRGFERNDRFPAVFAVLTTGVMAVGATVPELGLLLPIGAGVTAYGATYAAVHDGYIHRRLPGLRRRAPRRHPRLDHLAAAHALHHRFGGEPYGMLLPVIPAAVRARAARLSAPRVGAVPGTSVPPAPARPAANVGSRSNA